MPVKPDNPGQIGVIFQQPRQRGGDPPVDFRRLEMQTQQSQDWKGLDDISKGTRFEDEDLQCRSRVE